MHRTELPSRVLILQVERMFGPGNLSKRKEHGERVCEVVPMAALSCGRSCGPLFLQSLQEPRANRSGWASWEPKSSTALVKPKGDALLQFLKGAGSLLCDAALEDIFGPGPAPVDRRLCKTNMILPRLTQQPESNTRRWIQVSDFPGRAIPTRAGS